MSWVNPGAQLNTANKVREANNKAERETPEIGL
jgi:hypothetical protein